MIIYNVTVNVEDTAHDEWFTWMKKIHIPEVVGTGCFSSGSMYKLLVEEHSGTSYSIQYRAPNMHAIQIYFDKFAPEMRGKAEESFGGKFTAFRTLLEEV
ncbi:DUF4286 family protein [soil metagenome]